MRRTCIRERGESLTRLAGNLARPSGNVTGVTLISVEQDQKCLQLLKQVAPRTSRVAVLLNPDNAGLRLYPGVLEPVAARLGLAQGSTLGVTWTSPRHLRPSR